MQREWILCLIILLHIYLDEAFDLLLPVHARDDKSAVDSFHREKHFIALDEVNITGWHVAITILLILAKLYFNPDWWKLSEVHSSDDQVILGVRLQLKGSFQESELRDLGDDLNNVRRAFGVTIVIRHCYCKIRRYTQINSSLENTDCLAVRFEDCMHFCIVTKNAH